MITSEIDLTLSKEGKDWVRCNRRGSSDDWKGRWQSMPQINVDASQRPDAHHG